MSKAYKKPCASFRPQQHRDNVCAECFHYKEDHTKSLFEEKLGSNAVSTEDPTEVFELLDIIGTGAYGSVFMGREIATNGIYAIKFLELDKSKGNEIQSIVNEINIMKESMECPYIVEYHGCYMKDEIIMMVMEYCSCSLEDVLSFCPEIRFTETQIAAVCASIIKGLAFLHAYGITHRDIKSGNVLLKETGEVKLADFGVSHKLQHERDKMKTLAGSPYWCAPELITADSYDSKVDVWATGIVALEMAETRPPHWEMEPLQVIFHIPKEPAPTLKEPTKWSRDFAGFLDGCLQKNPMERASAKQLLSHSFILQGSSGQILAPVVKAALPIVLPRKQEDLKEEQDEDNETFQKGTMVAVDRNTYRADVVDAAMVDEKKMLTAKLNRGTVSKREVKKSDTEIRHLTINVNDNSSSNNNNSNSNNNGKYFGVSLEESMIDCEKTQSKHLIDQVIAHLLTKALDVDGLFRMTGDAQRIAELREKFVLSGNIPPQQQLLQQQPLPNVNLTQYHPHDITAVMKQYLRQLPESLLTSELFPGFIEAARMNNKQQQLNKVKALVSSLPPHNKKMLEKIVVFLAVVVSHSGKNKMTANNLAKALAPVVLFPGGHNTAALQGNPGQDAQAQQSLVNENPAIVTVTQVLIEQHKKLF